MVKVNNWLEDEADLEAMFEKMKGSEIYDKIMKLCPHMDEDSK